MTGQEASRVSIDGDSGAGNACTNNDVTIIALHLGYPKKCRRLRATTFPMHAWHPINQDPRFAGHGRAEVTSLERKILRWVSHVAAEPASHQRDVTGRNWPDSVPSLPGVRTSHLGLFRHLKCIIDLDAEIPHGAFEFGVP